MMELVAPPPTTATETWTYERYARATADGEWFTIIAGEKIMSPSPTVFYQRILLYLGARLQDWALEQLAGEVGVAPLDVVLTDTDVVQPDIIFISASHSERWSTQNVKGAPDMVVEIVSPDSTRIDRVKKRALYARHGVPEYWIVSPGEHTVEVLQLHGSDYVVFGLYEEGDMVQSPLLSTFTCAVKDIFRK